MRVHTNTKKIQRNASIGKYAAGGGLLILLAGLAISFFKQDDPQWQLVPFYTLVVGFLLSNLGIYFSNRYVRKPRPDEAVEGGLKGSDDRYYLYQHYLAAPHALVCPAGVFALVPKFQKGEVVWDGKRWKHKGARLLQSFFGQESLGNPNSEAAAEVEALARDLKKKLGDEVPPVQAILMFYNPDVLVDAADAPIPAMHVEKLKKYIRNLPKAPTLTAEQISKLDAALGL